MLCPLVHIDDLGNTNKDMPDLVILVSHGEHRTDPDLIESLHPDDKPYFSDYCDLDYDAGSFQLAYATAELLARKIGEKAWIRLIQIKIHRAFLDCNRCVFEQNGVDSVALRNIWDPNRMHDRIFDRLKLMHQDIMKSVLLAAKDAKMIFDVHTMASYSPSEGMFSDVMTVRVEPGGIKGYVDAFLNAKDNGGVERKIDIITSDSNGTFYSDVLLTAFLETALIQNGYPVERNNPYSFGNIDLLSKRLISISEFGGLSIDVPKNLLAKDGTSGIIREADIDMTKRDALAEVFVEALVKRCELLTC